MFRLTMFPALRGVVLLRLQAMVFAMLLGGISWAQGIHADFDIPAESLDQALNALAQQADIQIVFASDLARQHSSVALKGRFTVRAALERLLDGSGLEVREQAGSIYTVQAVNAPAGGKALPTVTVADTAPEDARGAVQGYVATRTASATKTDTPVLETPQSVSVITRERFESLGAQSINEALRYSAGISTFGAGTRTDWYTVIRGFDPNAYLDGLTLPTSINLADWRVDPYFLERIEVLRGPASVLFGHGEPGGVVNLVSKLPTAVPVHELEVQFGDHARRQVAGDVAGAIDDDGKVLYRLTGLVRDGNLAFGPFQDQRLALAPSLTIKPASDLSLTLMATYLRDRTNASDSFLPASGTVLSNPNGQISSTLFTGSPDFDRYLKQQWSLGYQLSYRLNDLWTLRQNLRYSQLTLTDYMTYGTGLDPTDASQSLMSREAGIARFNYGTLALDNQAQTGFKSGQMAHTVLLGVDYQRQRSTSWEVYAQTSDLNLYHPSYTPFDWSIFDTVTPQSTLSVRQQLGLYAQDQIRLGERWVLTAGLRHDWSKTTTDDLSDASSSLQKDSATTSRIGLTYLTPYGLAPFLSYSTSFNPVSGSTLAGNAFKPVRGRQVEAGVKFQPNEQTLLTAALFEIHQRNVLTQDPDDASGLHDVQTGQVRSRGVELEASAELARNLKLIGSYSYIQTINVSTTEADSLGKTPVDTPRPRHVASLWLDYILRGDVLNGLGIGGGVRYVGKSPGAADNSLHVPGYTLFDAALHYRLGHWQLSLMASNLLNKAYISGCYDATRCIYGNSRTLLAMGRYGW